jgi:hypothetical protein
MNANERELILKDEVYQIVGSATVRAAETNRDFLQRQGIEQGVLREGNESSAWVDRQFWCASTRMEALCQYKEDPIMEATECKSREFISVYSRAFAVDYIRG